MVIDKTQRLGVMGLGAEDVTRHPRWIIIWIFGDAYPEVPIKIDGELHVIPLDDITSRRKRHLLNSGACACYRRAVDIPRGEGYDTTYIGERYIQTTNWTVFFGSA